MVPIRNSEDVLRYASFALIYGAYVVCYFCRKNYAVWLTGLIYVHGIEKSEASIFGSVMEFSYGIGKFTTGPIVDLVSPSRLLVATILSSGLVNLLLFSLTGFAVDSVNVMLWAVNGLAQASIWPALALIFMNWFKTSPYRGTWYAILSTSQNLGAALTPAALSRTVALYGEHAATQVPGYIAVSYAIVLLVFLKDGPQKQIPSDESGSTSTKPSPRESVKSLLLSPQMWYLGIAYLFLTVIRVGVVDWSLVLLKEHHEVASDDAVQFLVLYELGGFVGGLAAGWVSDKRKAANGEHRIRTFQRLTVGLAFLIPVVVYIDRVPLQNPMRLLSVTYGLIGVCSFGPHMLVGLLSREQFQSSPSLAASLVKTVGQLGGMLGEYPIGLVATTYGWSTVGWIWVVCAICAAITANVVVQEETQKIKKA